MNSFPVLFDHQHTAWTSLAMQKSWVCVVTTCSSECRKLLAATREQLGCCVNVYNDTELSSRAGSEQFSYTLWSLCDVELVAEQCLSTIDSTRTQFDPNCTHSSFIEQRNFIVFCRRQYIESAHDAVGDACGPIDSSAKYPIDGLFRKTGFRCLY